MMVFKDSPRKRVCITLADKQEGKKVLKQRFKPIVLGTINSIKLGPDNRLYNVLD
jgi:hypothetical protein